MNKSVKNALLALPLISALLYSVQPSSGQGQATVKLKTSTQAKSDKKIVRPSGQSLVNSPDVVVLPGNDGKSIAQVQTSEPQAPSPQDPCTFQILLPNEVTETWLQLSTTCILCTVPSQLTHSNASVFGLSLSPNGPWTEELTVMTTLNSQGQGNSEHFFIKGEAEGATILHIASFLATNDYEFRVVPCACPQIPIVP